uniref:Large ribosomal subunit protein bL9 C-terminal domain-containing protein n=1 Tax=Florenciella parvula TaxID=236787 RepID=A0A7S2B4Y3_9STRA|mmetsp:Transcript_13062/g.27612  ORF Transcript_13062/g.27612 Transcript_13062/m.27612 type:complete len:551 (+) Transcript_13062:150-1802(+)
MMREARGPKRVRRRPRKSARPSSRRQEAPTMTATVPSSVAAAEAAQKEKEEKAEAKAKAEQPKAEVWYQKEGTARAAEPLWPDGCTFEMNYVTPWAVGYINPLKEDDEIIMLERHSVVPSHEEVTIKTKLEEMSIKIFLKFWIDDVTQPDGGHYSEAKPLGRINIKGLMPADVLKKRAKHARRKVKAHTSKEAKEALNFEQECQLKFKMSVRGFLEADLTCDPMSAKSAVKLVPRPKIPELRAGHWCKFMGKPFVVEAVHPPPVGTYDDNARIEVKVRALEEGLPQGWDEDSEREPGPDGERWPKGLFLDYGEREIDVPFDQLKHSQASSKGMSEEAKKKAEATKKRPVAVEDFVQIATNVYDVDANPEYKQFRYDVLGDEVDLEYVGVDKKFVAAQLKDWDAQVADELKNRDNKAAAEDEEEEEEEPKFLGLNPTWLTRRHVNAAEKFHIDEENKAAEREAQLRMANETKTKLEEVGVIEMAAKAEENGTLLEPIQKTALIDPMEEAIGEQLDHAILQMEQASALGEYPFEVGLGHGVVANMTLVVIKG